MRDQVFAPMRILYPDDAQMGVLFKIVLFGGFSKGRGDFGHGTLASVLFSIVMTRMLMWRGLDDGLAQGSSPALIKRPKKALINPSRAEVNFLPFEQGILEVVITVDVGICLRLKKGARKDVFKKFFRTLTFEQGVKMICFTSGPSFFFDSPNGVQVSVL